jgi:hypothetical protein
MGLDFLKARDGALITGDNCVAVDGPSAPVGEGIGKDIVD